MTSLLQTPNLLRAPRLIFFYIALLFLVSSCSRDEENPPIENSVLVSSELFSTRTASELQLIFGLSQIGIDPSVLKYDVEIYKITYTTEYKNDKIIASGLVILPKTSDNVSMVSFQHGTITANSDAPSLSSTTSPTLFLYAGLAAPGFIGVIPDFIGFGSSSNVMHPYYVESLTATSIIDHLKAAKELAVEKGKSFNGNLFLAGYSEGGYATMAAHKHIEEQGLEDFKLIASFPAAGGYDVKAVQESFFALDSYEDPYYIAYVAQAYKTTFDFTQPLSEFFQEPYASRIPTLFNGTMTGGQINAQLTTSIGDLITTDIRANMDTKAEYAYLRNAFIENSLVDWAPKIKMFLYHGDADITVPFENTVTTYNKLIGNGASGDVLTFYVIQGGDHATGFPPYLNDVIRKILSLN